MEIFWQNLPFPVLNVRPSNVHFWQLYAPLNCFMLRSSLLAGKSAVVHKRNSLHLSVLPFISIWIPNVSKVFSASCNGFPNTGIKGFISLNHNQHNIMFSVSFLSFLGNSFIMRYTGKMENFELLKIGTPSVFMVKDTLNG